MNVSKLFFFAVLAGSLALLGCGNSDSGDNGGTAGGSGTGGTAGAGGVAIAPGLYTSSPRGTLACLFVNEDGTKLVADNSCPWGPEGQGVAFRLTSVDPEQGSCAIYYPIEGDDPQEIPIVDGRFQIEATRTAGDLTYTIMVSGEFAENGRVSGVGSDSSACPDDRAWYADLGCCLQCQRDGWCE
jgi:hypothetical protein